MPFPEIPRWLSGDLSPNKLCGFKDWSNELEGSSRWGLLKQPICFSMCALKNITQFFKHWPIAFLGSKPSSLKDLQTEDYLFWFVVFHDVNVRPRVCPGVPTQPVLQDSSMDNLETQPWVWNLRLPELNVGTSRYPAQSIPNYRGRRRNACWRGYFPTTYWSGLVRLL